MQEMDLLDECADMLLDSASLRSEVNERAGAVPSAGSSPEYLALHKLMVILAGKLHLTWQRTLEAIIQHALSRVDVQSSLEPLREHDSGLEEVIKMPAQRTSTKPSRAGSTTAKRRTKTKRQN